MPGSARVLSWASLIMAICAPAQASSPVREAIQRYVNAVAVAETGEAHRGIESTLSVIDDLRHVLLAHVPDGKLSVLESLPEADFAWLEQLPGLYVQRIEVLVVNPVPDFFVALAARVGDEADRRFASALADTYPNAKWPVYVEPRTDYSGCTAFGEGKLLDTYLLWSAMERDFADRYVTQVSLERGRIRDKITRSTCACGDVASVVREFEAIAAALDPADAILPPVRERLSKVQEGRSNIRFGCIPG